MRVLITGGAGFLGSLLAKRLLTEGLALAGETKAPVDSIVIVDIQPPIAELARETRVTALIGEIAGGLDRIGPVDAIFHLAGVVSGAAELDFDLGMRTNLDGTRELLEWARRMSSPPIVVFTSSIAVFGSDPAVGPVGTVSDDTLPRPQSSYGIQKFIGEQLIADYTRKAFVRGRSVRLMTVAVRPGKPNAAASSFLSSIIREPLAGRRAICPVAADTPIALSSPSRTIDGIVLAAEASDEAWGSRTALNLPALTTTPRTMLAALDELTGRATSGLVDWEKQPAVAAIVESWPSRFVTERASRLGLRPNNAFAEVIEEYLESNAPQLAAESSGAG